MGSPCNLRRPPVSDGNKLKCNVMLHIYNVRKIEYNAIILSDAPFSSHCQMLQMKNIIQNLAALRNRQSYGTTHLEHSQQFQQLLLACCCNWPTSPRCWVSRLRRRTLDSRPSPFTRCIRNLYGRRTDRISTDGRVICQRCGAQDRSVPMGCIVSRRINADRTFSRPTAQCMR